MSKTSAASDGGSGTGEAVRRRLAEDSARQRNWKRWGPYLAERQWGTVREDYSEAGECWTYFPHDHARSRAYRWGEDGLLGITDRQARVCFALALWNTRDPILKERLFGLSGLEGNHGEDVKEEYFYLDATPTHCYLKALYKYPHAEFPYARLVEESRRRDKSQPEFELRDTGVFAEHRYFDVFAEYAKAAPEDILVRVTVANRGPDAADIHVLPTLWLRNTWSWGRHGEGYWPKGRLDAVGPASIAADHASLGRFRLDAAPSPDGTVPELLFTENETNAQRLFGTPGPAPFVKDAFHERVVAGRVAAVNPVRVGTKAAVWYRLAIPAGDEAVLKLRLRAAADASAGRPFGAEFDETFATRQREADDFHASLAVAGQTAQERAVARQARAGLLWSQQFFHYVVKDWLEGDPTQPPPPARRRAGRNADWTHLYNRDVLSVPDKWEYPWYAAWDLAFHMIPFARLDPDFAKKQLVLFLREWYMHPNGQLPAYELALSDANPPVHAWAAWRVYKMTGERGARDVEFLTRVFHKLLINFTWWVNRKDVAGKHVFSGGFLGLDNIGVFDRSKPLPTGGTLEQADGTAWIAFYCTTMLSIAMELARYDPAYEDVASKFFEHFVAIADAMNTLGGTGLWDETDGFYYDQLLTDGSVQPLKVRSMVGLLPLIAVEVLEEEVLAALPGFAKRLRWFLANRADLGGRISYFETDHAHRLLAIPSRSRLERVLRVLLDENEFLGPYGIRSLSKCHDAHPYVFRVGRDEWSVRYVPGESDTGLFGGNSNWRGPVWLPLNFLLVEALERYHHFFGDSLLVEFPTGSGRRMDLGEVAREIGARLARIFLPDASGRRPCHGDDRRYVDDAHFADLVLFHEYFHGETGRGVGASHQTGWTALVVKYLEDLALIRSRSGSLAGRRATPSAADVAQ